MVKAGSLTGAPRKTGFRLQDEIGHKGEDIWAEIVNGTNVGKRPWVNWGGKPGPVDVLQYYPPRGWQVKMITDPRKRVAFSGAHREVIGRNPLGGVFYEGVPQDKLDRIDKFYQAEGLEPYLVIGLYDERNNIVTYYVARGVANRKISEMEPLGTFNNLTGEFKVFGSAALDLDIPDINNKVIGTRLPMIPSAFIEGEEGFAEFEAKEAPFRFRLGRGWWGDRPGHREAALKRRGFLWRR